MRIRSITVNQFKKFTTPMCLENIGDGLNVVVGPNEMGKSTLLDALRAALFEKYSSKAQPIKALQNDRNRAGPVVELAFEFKEGIYRVRKRFIKKPYAHLFCPDGRKLEGDEAEDTLRNLLSFSAPSKSGANPDSLGMWSVLWVQQARSFGAINLTDSARSNLHNALESEVGSVLGGQRGRALPDSVEKQLGELITTSTRKPRGDYKALIDEINERKNELKELYGRRDELSKTLEDFEKAQEDLTCLSSKQRDQADMEELESIRIRRAELDKLESLINTATTDVELKKRNLEQADQALEQFRELKKCIAADSERVAIIKTDLDEARRKELELNKKVENLRKDVKHNEKGEFMANQDLSLKQRTLTALQRHSQILELKNRYKKVLEAKMKQRIAQKGVAAILVDDKKLAEIQKVGKAFEIANSQLYATATLVSFDMPSDRLAKIEINGKALESNQTSVESIETTNITIPDYGNISIQPRIEDPEKLIEQQSEAKKTLEIMLGECGVNSVEVAEEQCAKRQKLLSEAKFARKEVELLAPASDGYDAGPESLSDHIEDQKTVLDNELCELGIKKLPTMMDAEKAFKDAQASAIKAREVLSTSREVIVGPEERLRLLKTEVFKTRYDEGMERLGNLKRKLANDERKNTESDLETTVAEAKLALLNQEKIVNKLERQREGETLPQLDARITRLEKALQDRHDKRTNLKVRIAKFSSTIEVLEGAGVDETIQKKNREIEILELRIQQIKLEVSVLTLLSATLRSAESEAKERYLSPILNRVRPYFQQLFPGAEVAIDENLQIVGVVRQGGYQESFDHLSMGTQEQIAILVRLAFAEMLVECGHPATVVLDDSLVFSDDRRMERMFDILNMVGRQVQIIVLTCREQLFERVGGHHLSLQATSTEELASA